MKKIKSIYEELTNEEMAAFIISGLGEFFSEGAISEMASTISDALEEHLKHWEKKHKKLKENNVSSELIEFLEDISRLSEVWSDIYNQTSGPDLEQLEDHLVWLGKMTPKQREQERLKRGGNRALSEGDSIN